MSADERGSANAFLNPRSSAAKSVFARLPLDNLDAHLVGAFDKRELDLAAGDGFWLIGNCHAFLPQLRDCVVEVRYADADVIDYAAFGRLECFAILPSRHMRADRVFDWINNDADVVHHEGCRRPDLHVSIHVDLRAAVSFHAEL